MSKMKAQTEIIIVLGVIIVAVVATLFATKTINLLPPEPEAISILKASFRADVERKISTDTKEIIKKVAVNGGYLDLDKDPKPPILDYSGQKVAYWQFANLTITRVAEDFERAISSGLKESLKGLDPNKFETVKGKDVKIEPPKSVDVKIQDAIVTVKVDLPVSVEGYGFDSPLEIKVSSTLGKAITFANDLIGKGQKKELEYKENDETGQPTTKVLGVLENRYFERFLIDAMRKYSESAEDGHPKIPTEGVLTGCAEPPLIRTWRDVKPEMEDLISGVLENTYTAGKVPLGVTNNSRYPSYVLPVFSDLGVSFSLGKELDQKSFQILQNNSQDPSKVIVKTVNFGYTTVCVSPPYRVLYTLLYPIVAEVGDQDLKLRFAFHSFVRGYEPGDYKDLGIILDFFEEDIRRCGAASCPAKILVGDGTAPVKGARISYAYCDLGTTNEKGEIETSVPCGISLLEVWDKDHKIYSKLESSDNLQDKILFLPRISPAKLHIFNLEMTKQGDSYIVSDVKPNTENFTLIIQQAETPLQPGSESRSIRTSKNEEVVDLVREEFVTLGTAVYRGDSVLGATSAVFTQGISNDLTDLWIYNPILKDGYPVDANDPNAIIASHPIKTALENATYQCAKKINSSLPISDKPVNETKLKTCI